MSVLAALLAVTAVGHFSQANPDYRVSLDLPFKADLRRARGVEFDFRISDATQCSQFSFYYKSGAGWYATGFTPEASGKWVHVTIGRDRLYQEGTVGGWKDIEAVRTSVPDTTISQNAQPPVENMASHSMSGRSAGATSGKRRRMKSRSCARRGGSSARSTAKNCRSSVLRIRKTSAMRSTPSSKSRRRVQTASTSITSAIPIPAPVSATAAAKGSRHSSSGKSPAGRRSSERIRRWRWPGVNSAART